MAKYAAIDWNFDEFHNCVTSFFFMNTPPKFPPLELLKATHTFPGAYTFKVIGENQNSFPQRVIEAALMAAPESKPQHSVRETESGKHIAVTLEVHAESADRVVRIYEELVKLKGTVLVL